MYTTNQPYNNNYGNQGFGGNPGYNQYQQNYQGYPNQNYGYNQPYGSNQPPSIYLTIYRCIQSRL